MAPRRPTAVHVVEVAHQGRRLQFLTTSTADLTKQLKASCQLPAGIPELLARVATDHQGSADLPGVASVRHVSRLAAEQPPKGRPKNETQAQSAGAGLDAGRISQEGASSPAPAVDAVKAHEAAQHAPELADRPHNMEE